MGRGGRRYRRARARVRGKAGGPSTGAARGLEPGLGVPLLGRGTSGATFPASSRQGRLCPPEPDRRGTTLAASFLRWWEVREPPGNREGKVLNWGSSGSERGGCGKRAENRDSVLGVRSEVVSEVLRRAGSAGAPRSVHSDTFPAKQKRSLARRGDPRASCRPDAPVPLAGRLASVVSRLVEHTLLCVVLRITTFKRNSVSVCMEWVVCGKQRVNTPNFTATPEVEVVSTLTTSLLLTARVVPTPRNKGAF